MYAVFQTGGKQYRATTGDKLKVEKLEAEKGTTVELTNVLMVGEGADVKVGTPYLAGGKVTATVVEHGRGDKVKIIKFKRRKHHMKTQGHRQYFTTLEITGIDASESKPAKAVAKQETAEVASGESKAATKAPAKKAAAKKAPAKKAATKKTATKKTATKKAASKKTAAKKTAVKKAAVEDKGGE